MTILPLYGLADDADNFLALAWQRCKRRGRCEDRCSQDACSDISRAQARLRSSFASTRPKSRALSPEVSNGRPGLSFAGRMRW